MKTTDRRPDRASLLAPGRRSSSGRVMTATYAWIIDQDHLTEPGAEPGSLAENAATVTGPGNAPGELLAKLAAGEGRPFRLFDDDDELYYDGRIISTEGAGSEDDFGPLDDFGLPNAGCTYIQYKNAQGKWETL
jgi:hypothetical protein